MFVPGQPGWTDGLRDEISKVYPVMNAIVAKTGWNRAAALALLVLGVATAMPAAAQQCPGSYAATALHPLAQPAVYALDIRDPSPENQRLAQRFMEGVRGTGAKVDGTPTAMISIYYSVLGLGSSSLGGDEGPSYSDFGALSGGLSPSMPSESRMRMRQSARPSGPVTLSLRAELARPGTTQVIWVMSLQCQMTIQEPTQLAFEIGRVVGGALGKTVSRSTF
jgi:hypothetical protein